MYKVVCPLISIGLLLAGCGRSESPPLATSTPVVIIVVATATPTPRPAPTATPIPGFVAGEEEYAYDSFVAYYEDCLWAPDDPYDGAGVSDDYPGKAVYVGDGIWRFYVETYIVFVYGGGEDWEEEYTYYEEMVETRSLPDRTWENVCSRFAELDDRPDPADYAEHYDDYAVEEYEGEQAYEDWIHQQAADAREWEEPPEDSPYDSLRAP
jgi:hypothetical protein